MRSRRGLLRRVPVDSFEFRRRCVIDAAAPRLDFEGDLRKFVLIVLGPLRDPFKHMFHVCIQGPIYHKTGCDNGLAVKPMPC
jgi:hypothetical protein